LPSGKSYHAVLQVFNGSDVLTDDLKQRDLGKFLGTFFASTRPIAGEAYRQPEGTAMTP
jgi:hypothetical protein